MIEHEQREGLEVLRIDHGKVNAMDLELLEAMNEWLEAPAAVNSRAVILTGTGKAFSAGVDLVRLLNEKEGYAEAFLTALTRLFRTVFAFPRPVVAAVNGHAIAGGCILAAACDGRIMREDAGSIGAPELRVGVPFPAIALEIMRFNLPGALLQEVLYRGEALRPAEALEHKLVDRLSPAGNVVEDACTLAERYAAIPGQSFTHTKMQLRKPYLDRADAEDAAELTAQWTDAETRSAIARYVEKTLRK